MARCTCGFENCDRDTDSDEAPVIVVDRALRWRLRFWRLELTCLLGGHHPARLGEEMWCWYCGKGPLRTTKTRTAPEGRSVDNHAEGRTCQGSANAGSRGAGPCA